MRQSQYPESRQPSRGTQGYLGMYILHFLMLTAAAVNIFTAPAQQEPQPPRMAVVSTVLEAHP